MHRLTTLQTASQSGSSSSHVPRHSHIWSRRISQATCMKHSAKSTMEKPMIAAGRVSQLARGREEEEEEEEDRGRTPFRSGRAEEPAQSTSHGLHAARSMLVAVCALLAVVARVAGAGRVRVRNRRRGRASWSCSRSSRGAGWRRRLSQCASCNDHRESEGAAACESGEEERRPELATATGQESGACACVRVERRTGAGRPKSRRRTTSDERRAGQETNERKEEGG